MIHPNRTYLLQLKQRKVAVASSLNILKARRQALLMEFLSSVKPYLQSRSEIRYAYHQALNELRQSLIDDGQAAISTIAMVNRRNESLFIEEKNILGVKYYDVSLPGGVRRQADERNYDISASSGHVEECIDRFEALVEAMLSLTVFETKVKRIGEEILRVSRRSRVLEERVLPDICQKIKATDQYIGEREREEYFLLKKFKTLRARSVDRMKRE